MSADDLSTVAAHIKAEINSARHEHRRNRKFPRLEGIAGYLQAMLDAKAEVNNGYDDTYYGSIPFHMGLASRHLLPAAAKRLRRLLQRAASFAPQPDPAHASEEQSKLRADLIIVLGKLQELLVSYNFPQDHGRDVQAEFDGLLRRMNLFSWKPSRSKPQPGGDSTTLKAARAACERTPAEEDKTSSSWGKGNLPAAMKLAKVDADELATKARQEPCPEAAEANAEEGVHGGTGNALKDRHVNALEAMLELKASDNDSRRTAQEIAAKADGASADGDSYKRPLAELVQWGFAESQQGRKGGAWITKAGKAALRQHKQARK